MDTSATNITELLVVALAIFAVVMVMRKRYDSNLPLFFYAVAMVFTNLAGREVNPYLLYSGLAFALLLRFEFMGTGFAKFVAFLAGGSMCIMIWTMMSDVLS